MNQSGRGGTSIFSSGLRGGLEPNLVSLVNLLKLELKYESYRIFLPKIHCLYAEVDAKPSTSKEELSLQWRLLFSTLSGLPHLQSLEVNLRHPHQLASSSLPFGRSEPINPSPSRPILGGALGSMLSPPCTALTSLSLHGQMLDDTDLAAIGRLKSLTSLGLDWRLRSHVKYKSP